MPENRAPDYADRLAAEIRAKWLADINDTRSTEELLAAGIREGYKIGVGVNA